MGARCWPSSRTPPPAPDLAQRSRCIGTPRTSGSSHTRTEPVLQKEEHMPRSSLTRRTLVASSLAMPFIRPAAAQEMAKRFGFGQPGGVSTDASVDIFMKPFTARTGIEIVLDVPSSFGKLRAMVASGNVTSSLWDLGSQQIEQARALGMIEPIDWDQVDPGPMYPEMKNEFGFGQTYFSTVMAWRKDVK